MTGGRYQAYPKCMNSVVDWIGSVPKHWDLVRLKYASELKGRKVIGSRNSRYVGLENIESITGKYLESDSVSEGVSESFSSKEILFGKLRPYLAKSWLADFSGVCSSEFLVLKNRLTDARFLNYFTLMEGFIQQVDASTYGSKMPRASWDFIGLLEMPCPPIGESTQIAKFLDHETAKIDRLIEKQQTLIALLKEKRQAVISHAVTKGLDPNAAMKDSGIEWLGEVPEHWAVVPVSYRYEVQLGKMLDSRKITGTNLRQYLRVADVQWGENKTEALPQMDFDKEAREKFRLKLGDLLVNEGGSYPGRSAIWRGEIEECYYQKALHRMRPLKPEADTTSFFYYVLYLATEQGVFVAGGNEATIEHLPAEKLRGYRFAFPPTEEQSRIVEFLDAKITKFDEISSNAELQVTLLQERRTALISAAVTGKIDVRAWQPVVGSEMEPTT